MSRQEDFINTIAPYVQKWQQAFSFGVCSAIIAQACLESAFGQSNKAGHGNYFGLKYKKNRVTCNSGVFEDRSAEQKPDGTYITIVTNWFEFMPAGIPDMNTGVQGYFQFIQSGPYKSALTQTTPQGYLQALKDSGYATSQKYVENCMNLVNRYNLTQFDGGQSMYSNSPLVVYTDLSPGNYGPRTHAIDTITIHHMAGNLSVETCGALFHRKKGNSNYGIGTDGRIALYVEEKNGAWTSSNKANDMRAITIEVANELCAPYWTVSAAAMNSLILLVTDICQRNGIQALIWSEDKNARINHANGCNMTLHRDFAATACPGDFLKGCMANIAMLVNANLAGGVIPTPSTGYIINGYDYSPVFDPVYYADRYADLKAAFGTDANALWNHFQTCGMNEFRQASDEFNPEAYKARYSDLQQAYGDDNPMYYFHYVAFGKAEGRSAV